MAEDRTWIYLGKYRGDDFWDEGGLPYTGDTSTNSNKRVLSANRAHRKMKRIRDEIRAALNDSLKWLVTDMFIWSSSSSALGHAFIVRHLDGAGTPTGHEWLFLLNTPTQAATSTSRVRYTLGLGNNTTIGNYFFSSEDGLAGGFDTAGSIAVHYNSRSGLDSTGASNDRYETGFDNFANGTYAWHSVAIEKHSAAALSGTIEIERVGGGYATATYQHEEFNRVYFTAPSHTDFKVGGEIRVQASPGIIRAMDRVSFDYAVGDYMPILETASGISPYSNLAGFLNSNTKLRGVVCEASDFNGPYMTHWGVLFDHTRPFLCIYATYSHQMRVRSLVVMGNLIEPKASSHNQSEDGVLWMEVDTASTTPPNEVDFRLEAFYDQFSTNRAEEGAATAGTPWDRDYRTDFSAWNQPRKSDGEYDWDIITVQNDNEVKGYIKDDVLRVIGDGVDASQFDRTWSTVDATYRKLHRYIGWPWKNATPVFPPIPWGQNAHTGNPNTDPGEILADGDI